MSIIQFHKVTALPGTLAPNAFYYVENGTYAESYLTNQAGAARAIGNSVMINALIDAKLASQNAMEIVADIAARDALTGSATSNLIILVNDASADSTVNAGAALYSWDNGAGVVSKLSEFESLDVTLTWSALTGAPTSTPAAIDQAVTDSHTHANLATLNKLGEGANGEPTYAGAPVGSWNTNGF